MGSAVVVRLAFWLWFGAAAAAGHFLLLQRLPPAAIPAIVLFLTAVLVSLYLRVRPVRAWADALDLRMIVLFHVTRFVGIYFLVLFQRGDLPRAFAVPAGLGDILVATMALPVAFAPIEPALRRRAIVIWNVVGFVDILFVVANAARLIISDPAPMRAFTHLPLSLLPTFLVPLIIASHIVLFIRTAKP